MKNIYGKMARDININNNSVTLNDIKSEINNQLLLGKISRSCHDLAFKTIDYIKEANYNIHTYGNDEKGILLSCWARACDNPEPHQSNTKANIILALADCYEDGKDIVCPMGRVNKILGGLAISDYEYMDQKVITEEEMRNNIFTLCHQELRKILDKYKKIGGELGDAAKSYDDINIVATQQGESKLNEIIAKQMVKIINNNSEGLREPQRERIKNEVASLFELNN